MRIEQNRIDDLNLELTLAVTSEDYAENRKKKLNDYRKKANSTLPHHCKALGPT